MVTVSFDRFAALALLLGFLLWLGSRSAAAPSAPAGALSGMSGAEDLFHSTFGRVVSEVTGGRR